METTLKNLKNPLKRPLKNPEKSLWIFSGHPVSNNRELSLLYPNNAIWNIEKFGQEFRDSYYYLNNKSRKNQNVDKTKILENKSSRKILR